MIFITLIAQQRNRSSRFYILVKIVLVQDYAYGQEVVPYDTPKTDSIKHHTGSVQFQKANDISKQYNFGKTEKNLFPLYTFSHRFKYME